MEFDEAVKNRRSIRKFKPGIEIPAADLEEIVKTGMRAPNMANRRPWEFYIVTNRESLEKISCGLTALRLSHICYWPHRIWDMAAAG